MGLESSWLLIFGGCCSNVFTLEAIVKYEPDSGLIITFVQFVLASLFALPSQLYNEPRKGFWPGLRAPSIPIVRLALIALMFFSVNMLNNWAFAFHISVPLHIILRSFGSVTTLTVGWLAGKKYSVIQICSVGALTVGVIVSAWADARQKGAQMQLTAQSADSKPSDLFAGIAVLFAAQLVSAIMGIYVESTYARYGRHWRENLFYSHFLGLFFSIGLTPTLIRQGRRLLGSPGRLQIPVPQAVAAWLGDPGMVFTRGRFPDLLRDNAATGGGTTLELPLPLLHLAMNAVTQVVCISGVNRLSAQTTAVTVTVVLNLRKLVSFLLSCVIFGNPIGGLMGVGATIVFASGALYGWDSSRGGKKNVKPVKDTVKAPIEMERLKENGSAAAR